MANRERGEVALKTNDGRDLVLKLTTNSCARLEQESGKSFEEWNVEWSQRNRITALRWLMWAGLQDQHCEIARTPEATGDLMDQLDQASWMRAMTSFLYLQSEEFKALIKAGILQAAKAGDAADPPMAQADPAGVDSTSMLASSV